MENTRCVSESKRKQKREAVGEKREGGKEIEERRERKSVSEM